MIQFEAILNQFEEKGEKTGWTYIQLTRDIVDALLPGHRKTFRVKGKIDAFSIKAVAVMPMGDGSFILPVNATMRKGIRKGKGAMVKVVLSVDTSPPEIAPAWQECLQDEPEARAFFEQLPLSQRNYYSNWVIGVKNEMGQAKRMAQAIDALILKQNFVAFMQALKLQKKSTGPR